MVRKEILFEKIGEKRKLLKCIKGRKAKLFGRNFETELL